jgi:molecular chaperone HtpG
MSSSDTYAFQAEINQLLSLIINTFYSNKDIFLRELISNASDAIDKSRFQLLATNHELRDFMIQIESNESEKTLTITDNGVGMTKQDMIDCLGTIANSGTKQFMETLKDGTADMSMIGQFGVGFYSAYLVADNVKVYSKHLDSPCVYLWESQAGGSFTITEVSDFNLEQGTKIVMNIKEDCVSYLVESKIKEIVKTHSEYITHPIQLWTVTTETKEVPCEDDEEETKNSEEGTIEEIDEKKSTEPPKTKSITETREEWIQINTQKPIWQQKPEDVTDEEHAAFYKSLTNDWDSHMAVKHFQAEGQVEFKSLIYVPKRAPFDMFKQATKKNNIKLYVKRVFIMDTSDDLIPDWLSFVHGIVDSEDLPLNVSREMLQQNKIMRVIKKTLIKKCIEMINDMVEDEDKTKYSKFYEQFHQSIKLGIHEDSTNRDKLVKLLRFETLRHSEPISLEDYVNEMNENQNDIYYITGESRRAVERSPFVQGLASKGYDVLFMVDPIDEYMTQQVREFDSRKLVNVTKHNDVFVEKNTEMEENICKKMAEILKNDVDKVIVSTRLEKEPCCLVSSEYGWSANMERIMKAQTLQNNKMAFSMAGKKTMEINPKHPIIKKLQDGIIKSSMSDKTISNITQLMYDTSLISCGYTLEDPSMFVSRINNMISMGIDVDVEDTSPVDATDDTTESSIEKEPNTKMEEVD